MQSMLQTSRTPFELADPPHPTDVTAPLFPTPSPLISTTQVPPYTNAAVVAWSEVDPILENLNRKFLNCNWCVRGSLSSSLLQACTPVYSRYINAQEDQGVARHAAAKRATSNSLTMNGSWYCGRFLAKPPIAVNRVCI